MSYIWTLQNCISEKWLKLVIKNNLIDQFKQIWNSSIETSLKGDNQKLFKEELKFENYLDILEDKDTFTLCRFRTVNVTDYQQKWGDGKKLLEKTGSVIYVQEENWETSITIFLNVLNLLMKKKLDFDIVHRNRPNIIRYSNLMSSKSIYTLSKLRIVNKRICPLD